MKHYSVGLSINNRISVALLSVLLLSACTKNDPVPTRTEMLTNHNWRMDSMTSPLPPITGYTSIVLNFSNLPPCRVDNTYRFESSGRYVFDDGAITCATVSQTGVGTWQWLNNETQIETNLDGSTVIWNVEQLTENRMKLVESQYYSGVAEYMWRVYVPK